MPVDTPAFELTSNLRGLLDWLAVEPSRPCRMCGKQIWLIHDPKTCTLRPYTGEAVNHNFDCPGAARYRREQAEKRREQPSLFNKHPEAL